MRRFGRGARYYSPFGPCLALLGPSFGCYRSFRALPAAATSVLCRWFAKAFVPSAASVGVVPLHLSWSGCRVERRGQTIVVLAHHAWRKRGEGRGEEEGMCSLTPSACASGARPPRMRVGYLLMCMLWGVSYLLVRSLACKRSLVWLGAAHAKREEGAGGTPGSP